ncbi:TetR/AcrR family transcriptional regulator [Candidatus Mycobacterium wuenschmannii]|uniref:TetR/AcrR family transcriptional regulator n=1 Tax=Candidatus Mycobacterium wuenschmannii TaxID=3027808 RepID=A0ABY8VYI3_9MYCO|nr:TetR/AcrR family transcriptional regulator [Candidatus Mycobacterium wuenschmannii]WIM87247.1 TetR/AcrR family transcriptional regulator [Candidatus Mycobacterium wuenschmannii]
MAPPRKHQTDVILDAARTLVLTDGPRAASVGAIAKASGAPAGTLYHRFTNRDGILAAAWLRALIRFQDRALAATAATALESAVATAVAAIEFMRAVPDDARLLVALRPGDLLDDEHDLQQTLADQNAPLIDRLNGFARELYGSTDPRCTDAVARAIVDLPYAVVRRHANTTPIPDWLETDVAAAARALLTSFDGVSGRPDRGS